MNSTDYIKKLTSIKPARNVFVCCLDILGFSDFVENVEHDVLVKTYQAILRTITDNSLAEVAEQIVIDSQWLKDVKSSQVDIDLVPKLDNVTLHCITISDSIILATDGCELRDFMNLAATVRNLMVRMLYFGLPLRGAIAYGKMTFDSDLSLCDKGIIHHQVFGLPIVKATVLEKRQNWSGCAIHPDVVEKLWPKIVPLDPIMITFYDVPLKEKEGVSSEGMWVINWVQGIADADKVKVSAKKIESAFSEHGKKVMPTVAVKIKNTVMFYEDMVKHPAYKMSLDEWLADMADSTT